MDLYMVIKVCKQCYRFVVINLTAKYNGRTCKNICVTGNLPELYNRMTVELDVSKDKASDYSVELTEKNISTLEKNGVDVEKYKKALAIHAELKSEGCSWDIYQTDTKQLYKKMPFQKADRLHRALADNPVDTVRLEAICDMIIKYARSRHTSEYNIEDYLEHFEGFEKLGAYEPLPAASKVACLQFTMFGFFNGKVYDYDIKKKEQFIKEDIDARIKDKEELLKKYEIDGYLSRLPKNEYIAEQLAVLKCLNDTSPCIITGKAGTGKTSVIKLLIECFKNFRSRESTLLAAPTGKASRRLEEKTGMTASTIHRALRKKPDDNFVYYNEYNPLGCSLMIVDESSMIDTLLMYDLLNAAMRRCKIIFVGDINQLAPVGYGEPFFDFLKVLPIYRLNVNHRQEDGTQILEIAEDLLEGKGLHEGNGVTISHVKYDTIQLIIEGIANSLDDKEYQIISPYNQLNNSINEMMKKGENPFNANDKVIMTRNTENYCNGDIGFIKKIEYFSEDGLTYGYRRKFKMTIDIEGNEIVITEQEREDVMLAYAITVHKMQGSEAKRIIVISPDSPVCLSNARLIYTAVTRARKRLDFILFTQ